MLRRLIAGLALTAGLSVALAPAARSADTVELTVGKLLELTGPLSETGPSQDKAVKLAIAHANKAAADAGVPITAKDVGADVQGDPQAALSAARTLIDDLPLFAATRTVPAKDAVDELAKALAALNPDEMSPREALEALYALKLKAAKKG